MAARAPTLSILLVSVLSLFATKSLAHNRVPFPASCIGNPSLVKCAVDFEFAPKAAASGQTHISAGALHVVLDSINAAKTAGLSIIHVLSTKNGGFIGVHPNIELVNNLNSTIGIALGELIKAYTAIQGETKLSLSQLHKVDKSLKMASEVGAKLNACVGLKQAGHINSNVLLNNLIKQFISLTNLSLKVVATIKAAAKISL